MTTFTPRPITPANFKNIRTKLINGIGFFSDGVYRYAVADSNAYRLDIVRRTKSITWSNTISALPSAFKVVVNGGFFGPEGVYKQAKDGVVDPTLVTSNGDVKQGGKIVEPDNGAGSDFFFFGHDAAAPPVYSAGRGNPPTAVTEGSGALGPMILTNPTTKAPLRFGARNIYTSDPNKSSIPASPAEFADCVQRSNARYASVQSQAEGFRHAGFCVVAVLPSDSLVIVVAKPQGDDANLDTIRDALFSVKCTLACFTDASTSTSMAVDGVMEPGLAPASYKDGSIETGFGLFLYKPAPGATLNVAFTQVEVLDDETFFGSNTWTLNGDVNGSTQVLLNKAEVDTGQIINLSAGFQTTVTVPPGADLVVTITGTDSDNGNLGTPAAVKFGASTTPGFGVGTHLITARSVRVTIVITNVRP
ncbi:MAG: hypothetical protein ABI548_07200 [Polyangiaceae bacterium]